MCGAAIPKRLGEAIEKFGDDNESVEKLGIEYAAEQCRDLLKNGVPGIHFYTLNKSGPTEQIYRNLGLSNGRSS